MTIQWTQVLDRLVHAGIHPDAMSVVAQRGAERFAQNDMAKQAWADLANVPPAKLRTQFLKALQLSGLSDVLTESVWRQFMHQEPHAMPTGDAGDLFHDALEIAATRINDLEWPPLSNQGADLVPYLQAAGIHPGNQWCMAFVCWCVAQAARNLERVNPLVQTGSCKKQWEEANGPHGLVKAVPIAHAMKDPTLVKSGAIFIHQYGDGHGHTGFVEAIDGQRMTTVEGNSNPFGVSGLGLGVYRCTHRALTDSELMGFIQI